MHRLCIALGTACTLISGQALAFNPVQGWYGGITAEASYAPTLRYYVINPLTTPPTNILGELSYRIGGGGGGQLGYRCAPWRFEAEVLFNINSYSKLQLGNQVIKRMQNSSNAPGLTMRGDTYFITGMLNAFYDFYQVQFSVDSQIVPYIGIGIGYAHVQNEVRLYYNGQSVYPTAKESSNEGAVQAIIGANYWADDFTTLGIDYRYFATSKVGNSTGRYHVNTLNLTLNFAFDSAA